eukprot:gnl/TRDRNA2_/TRDRNA2_157046_c0_seq2.p1 gnl/TRDRNA2_/TRDRNA2_157046_c0~~gnl/TRDRNA2_/TRDRNA2_157046_c0_seq2.p1  ORF type:complete len:1060 (-),score=246.53 gnl/TRDRNA2_/TRDRNA2_157046_c0_seq2:92-3271(-)
MRTLGFVVQGAMPRGAVPSHPPPTPMARSRAPLKKSGTSRGAQLSVCVPGWQQLLRDFMGDETDFDEMVQQFAQKFVLVAPGSINFSLSTLTDFTWVIIVITWEAMVNGKLPLASNDPMRDHDLPMDADVIQQMNHCRMAWLKELGALRDARRRRNGQWNDNMEATLQELMDEDIYRFVPEDAMDAQTRKYFRLAMEENLKLAMTKGAACAGDDLQKLVKDLTAQVAQLKESLAAAEEQRESLALQLEFAESNQTNQTQHRPESAHREQLAKLRAEAAEMQKANQDLEKKVAYLTERLKEGRSGDPQAAREMEEQAEALKQQAGEAEALAARSAKLAEQEAAKAKKLEETTKEQAQKLESLKNELAESKKREKELSDKLRELQKKEKGNQQGTKGTTDDEPAKVKSLREEMQRMQAELDSLKKAGKVGQGSGKQDSAAAAAALAAAEAAADAEASKRRAAEELAKKAAAEAEELRRRLAEAERLGGMENRKEGTTHVSVVRETEVIEVTAEADGSASDELEALKRKTIVLQKNLEEAREESANAKESLARMTIKFKDTAEMNRRLELAMAELQKKFNDLRGKLKERGIDESIIDDALQAVGLDLAKDIAVSVFDRLYNDAVRRVNKWKLAKGKLDELVRKPADPWAARTTIHPSFETSPGHSPTPPDHAEAELLGSNAPGSRRHSVTSLHSAEHSAERRESDAQLLADSDSRRRTLISDSPQRTPRSTSPRPLALAVVCPYCGRFSADARNISPELRTQPPEQLAPLKTNTRSSQRRPQAAGSAAHELLDGLVCLGFTHPGIMGIAEALKTVHQSPPLWPDEEEPLLSYERKPTVPHLEALIRKPTRDTSPTLPHETSPPPVASRGRPYPEHRATSPPRGAGSGVGGARRGRPDLEHRASSPPLGALPSTGGLGAGAGTRRPVYTRASDWWMPEDEPRVRPSTAPYWYRQEPAPALPQGPDGWKPAPDCAARRRPLSAAAAPTRNRREERPNPPPPMAQRGQSPAALGGREATNVNFAAVGAATGTTPVPGRKLIRCSSAVSAARRAPGGASSEWTLDK